MNFGILLLGFISGIIFVVKIFPVIKKKLRDRRLEENYFKRMSKVN